MKNLKKFVFHYDKIAIGHKFSSILYCLNNNIPIILNGMEPLMCDFFHKDIKLHNIKYKNINPSGEMLTCTGDKVVFGVQKRYPYRYILFLMSLSGLVPIPSVVKSIRIENTNELTASISDVTNIKFTFDELIILDGDLINGIESESIVKDYLVADWMNIDKGYYFEQEYCENKDDRFINKIFFYISKRGREKKKERKDLVAISYLNENEIKLEDYDDFYAKFKVESIMKDKMNINPIKTNPRQREIRDITEYRYKDIDDSIKFLYLNEKDVIEECNLEELTYCKKLIHYYSRFYGFKS